MSTTIKRRAKATPTKHGVLKASVPGFVLLKVRGGTKPQAQASDQASAMVERAGKALSRPGLNADLIFKRRSSGAKPVYAYSVDPSNTERFIQIGADGSRKVGRLVKNRFIEIKALTSKAA